MAGRIIDDDSRRVVAAILAQGRVKDPDELLKEFLGRAPAEDAFLKQIGIEAGGTAQR